MCCKLICFCPQVGGGGKTHALLGFSEIANLNHCMGWLFLRDSVEKVPPPLLE